MISKFKRFFQSVPKVIPITAGLITISSTLYLGYNYFIGDIIKENQKLKNQLVEKQMTLWVKNNTDSPRHFNYRDKIEGNGKGEPILPGKIKAYYFKKAIYNLYNYEHRNGFTKIDTIKKGEFLFKYYQQKELIIIDK